MDTEINQEVKNTNANVVVYCTELQITTVGHLFITQRRSVFGTRVYCTFAHLSCIRLSKIKLRNDLFLILLPNYKM